MKLASHETNRTNAQTNTAQTRLAADINIVGGGEIRIWPAPLSAIKAAQSGDQGQFIIAAAGPPTAAYAKFAPSDDRTHTESRESLTAPLLWVE